MAAKTNERNDEQAEGATAASQPEMDEKKNTNSEVPVAVIIEVRAYEIYQRRGDREGDAVADWLLAEQEIMKELGLSDAARTAAGDQTEKTESTDEFKQKSTTGNV